MENNIMQDNIISYGIWYYYFFNEENEPDTKELTVNGSEKEVKLLVFSLNEQFSKERFINYYAKTEMYKVNAMTIEEAYKHFNLPYNP